MSPANHTAMQASVYDKTLGMIESALEKSVGMKSVGKGKTKKMTLLIQRLGQLAPECCNRYDDVTRLLDESGGSFLHDCTMCAPASCSSCDPRSGSLFLALHFLK